MRLDRACSAECQQMQCRIAAHTVLWKCIYTCILSARVLWNSKCSSVIIQGNSYKPLEDTYIPIEDKDKTKFIISSTSHSTTTTFIASCSQTSPDDMCISVNINGGQTTHTVTVERKASRRCVCQVFYHWEGINCWKITFAFFPEHLLGVSL